jgi:hypothetical protein
LLRGVFHVGRNGLNDDAPMRRARADLLDLIAADHPKEAREVGVRFLKRTRSGGGDVIVSPHGCPTMWPPGRASVWPPGRTAVWLKGHAPVWSSGPLVAGGWVV